jgi:eukaryotic-like serine/threonine-protein kinase
MGQIITFYSFKGGTGRSMALANVACCLARLGRRVLMVDWDLESPGLHRFFSEPARYHESGELDSHPGLIDVLVELDTALRGAGATSEAVTAALLGAVQFENFVVTTTVSSLHLMKAGRFDDNYSRRVAMFDWEGLHARSPWLMRLFAEHLSQQYDYVLVDSRTGLSDISGICTALLPEKMALIFTPNRQSLFGGLDAAHRATKYRRHSDDLRTLLVFPVPSRVEAAEAQLRREWRFGADRSGFEGYQRLWENTLQQFYDLDDCDLGSYFDEVMIPHVPRYAFGEEIAVLLENRDDRFSLANTYQSISDWLTGESVPWDPPALRAVR